MNATFNAIRKEFNPNFRKEGKLAEQYTALTVCADNNIREQVIARFYKTSPTSNTVYCCLWLYANGW